jgi:hypothetical protein
MCFEENNGQTLIFISTRAWKRTSPRDDGLTREYYMKGKA